MKMKHIEALINYYQPKINRNLAITKAEYRRRWQMVQEAMAAKGYGLAYACGSELDRSDIAWLAGVFDPIIERYGILVPVKGTPVVVAGSEGGHVIADCLKASGARLALLREFQISDEDYRFAAFERLEDIIFRLVPFKPGRPLKIALLSSSQFIPYDHVKLFEGRFGGENVVFDVDLLRRIKYEKSMKELQIIQTANIIADAAFLGMLAVLKPGITELDVAAVGDYIMKRLGARRTGFPTIVSSGTRGRTVLGPATNRRLKKGEWVSLGISPTFNGYHGIMRRTVKIGHTVTQEEQAFLKALEGLYQAVMKATIQAAKKNLPAKYIDRKGKEFLERTKLLTLDNRRLSPREPYTFIHNTGCSECQEGYGAVTPYSEEPLGRNVALMIDVAFTGFDEQGRLVFPLEYAVIEDSFWKIGDQVGVYNQMPLNVQMFVGQEVVSIPRDKINPYYRPLPGGD
ncbi:MAG: aminopeptidase P family protein [Candidatus Aminicenantes bacterium]|nr:aminopeptidase P family protein [Candidatus Aminicenantes bacterium]